MIGIIVFVGFLFCIGFLRMMFHEGQAMYKDQYPEPIGDSTPAEREYNRLIARQAELMDQLYGKKDASEAPTVEIKPLS